MATAQDNNISACRRATAFFRQRAVGGHERFQSLLRVHGGGQRDQPSWLQSAEGRIDVLTTQVFALDLVGCAQPRQGFNDGTIQRRCGSVQVLRLNRLTGRIDEVLRVLTGDGTRQMAGAHQLLFGPGGLPDQQAKRVRSSSGTPLLLR